jgi:hypothetical protein
VKALRNYLVLVLSATFVAGSFLFLCAVIGRNI